mgnify:CR=1 FL=1
MKANAEMYDEAASILLDVVNNWDDVHDDWQQKKKTKTVRGDESAKE